ncbi:hypothetical protein OIU74_004670, partial [Salix koriyanagi]
MAGEDVDLSSLTLQVGETREMWKQEMERRQSQVDVLQVQTYGGEGLCTRVGGTCKGVGGPVAKSENNLDIVDLLKIKSKSLCRSRAITHIMWNKG